MYLEDNIHELTESQLNALAGHLESVKKRTKEQEKLLEKVNMEKEARIYLAKIYDQMDKDEAERTKEEEEQLAVENEIAILKGKYLEKIAEQERKWKNIKAVTGEEVETEETTENTETVDTEEVSSETEDTTDSTETTEITETTVEETDGYVYGDVIEDFTVEETESTENTDNENK